MRVVRCQLPMAAARLRSRGARLFVISAFSAAAVVPFLVVPTPASAWPYYKLRRAGLKQPWVGPLVVCGREGLRFVQ